MAGVSTICARAFAFVIICAVCDLRPHFRVVLCSGVS